MTDIATRTAFITGGANGIGLGIARALAKAGAKLALVDLDAEALAAAAAELGPSTPVFSAVLDVRDREAYARVASESEAALGPVTILVNNAGVAAGASIDRLNYALWDWGLGINLGGVFNGIRTFVPAMLARGGGGHVVNTASGAGLWTTPGNTLYCTSKFAVVGMSEALHGELQPQGIGVTVLCPGPVATGILGRTRAHEPDFTSGMPEDLKLRMAKRDAQVDQALAQGVHPDAVGEMVVTAIRENNLYIHTDRISAGPIAARTEALLAAMPPAA